MNRTDLIALIRDGENSVVEFKRDDVHSDKLAKEMAALLNFEGGCILLGVEDDGAVSGLTRSREKAERWVMDIARNNIRPAVVPSWSSVTFDDGRVVGAVGLPADGLGKPYKARRGAAWISFYRVGSTSREATREEEGRLRQQAGLHYDRKRVPGAGLESLDLVRLENYFRVILKRRVPADREEWLRVLGNLGLLEESAGTMTASVAGLLLFGRNPNRRLPQAGITAAAFPSTEKDYDAVDEEFVRGPLVSSFSSGKRVQEKGVIDRAVDFVARNAGTTAWIESGRRRRRKALPTEAVREAIVNAVAHRDYTIEVADVELSLYGDRLEVISPGRLPNGVTVEKMKEGMRVARNELLKEVLRDYRYVEHFSMGVRNRIIKGMQAHNGTEPDLVEEENRFTVRLWKRPVHP